MKNTDIKNKATKATKKTKGGLLTSGMLKCCNEGQLPGILSKLKESSVNLLRLRKKQGENQDFYEKG